MDCKGKKAIEGYGEAGSSDTDAIYSPLGCSQE